MDPHLNNTKVKHCSSKVMGPGSCRSCNIQGVIMVNSIVGSPGRSGDNMRARLAVQDKHHEKEEDM